MPITLGHYLVLAAVIFTIGVFGVFLNRRNIIVILMSIELMLLAVNLNFVAFSSFLHDMVGQVFVMFVLTVAAARSPIIRPKNPEIKAAIKGKNTQAEYTLSTFHQVDVLNLDCST